MVVFFSLHFLSVDICDILFPVMMTMTNSFKKEPPSFCFETCSDSIGGF